MNKTLELIPEATRQKSSSKLRPVESLVISPSQSVDQIASKYLHSLPTSIRVFLHGIGATRSSGSSVLSYLLFDRLFCCELIELGYHDAMGQVSQIEAFLESE